MKEIYFNEEAIQKIKKGVDLLATQCASRLEQAAIALFLKIFPELIQP